MKIFMLVLLSVLLGCIFEDSKKKDVKINRYKSIKDTLYVPFDTNKVIRLMDIQYEKSIPSLAKDLDTLVLNYAQFACDCPQWIDTIYSGKDLHVPQSKNFSYYLEPKNNDVNLDESLLNAGNKIRVIGKLKTENGWPKDPGLMSPNPPKGKVFVYSSYKVLFPLRVWGPLIYAGRTQIPNGEEELIHRVLITIPSSEIY